MTPGSNSVHCLHLYSPRAKVLLLLLFSFLNAGWNFKHGWKRQKKENISWCKKMTWNLNSDVRNWSSIGTQPCLLVYVFSVAAFVAQKSNCHGVYGCKAACFPTWFFTAIVCWSPFQANFLKMHSIKHDFWGILKSVWFLKKEFYHQCI